MNFQQLEYAIAVQRHQHFGKAADSCNVTQATLSAMLKRLEEEIGFIIFDRSKHPIQTTEEGTLFLSLAAEILDKRAAIFSLKNDDQSALSGSLNLGIIPTVSNTLLPLVLPEIMAQNPKLQLNIKEITTEEIVQQLDRNQIDLGILSTPLPDDFDHFEENILYYESMMVYGIDQQTQALHAEELKHQKVWLLDEGHCFRNQSMAICDMNEQQMQEQQLNIKANSFDTLINLSEQFDGCTLIPELYFNRLSKTQKMKAKYFAPPIPVREISMISSKPLKKRKSMLHLSQLIREIVPPKLKSTKHPNKDLDIIAM